MKKRALRSMSVVLWLIVLLTTTGVHAAPVTLARWPGLAASDPVIRFSPSSSTVDPGATLFVDIVVDNVLDLGAFQFTVAFDSTVVQVQDVTLGSFLGSTGRTVGPLGPQVDNTAGVFIFGGFSYGVPAGPNETGTVARVTLKAVGVGSSTALTFTAAQLTNTAGGLLLPLTTTPGSVTVRNPRIYLPVLYKVRP